MMAPVAAGVFWCHFTPLLTRGRWLLWRRASPPACRTPADAAAKWSGVVSGAACTKFLLPAVGEPPINNSVLLTSTDIIRAGTVHCVSFDFASLGHLVDPCALDGAQTITLYTYHQLPVRLSSKSPDVPSRHYKRCTKLGARLTSCPPICSVQCCSLCPGVCSLDPAKVVSETKQAKIGEARYRKALLSN